MQPLSEVSVSDDYPGCHVIAFDRPPFGLSQRPLHWEEGRDPYSSEGGARLAAGLLDALGVRSAVIVGHSMGATVSVELLKQCARENPCACLPCAVSASCMVERACSRRCHIRRLLRQIPQSCCLPSDRRPDLVAGLAWVAPALPAKPDQWRRSLNVGQQLQQVRFWESATASTASFARTMHA